MQSGPGVRNGSHVAAQFSFLSTHAAARYTQVGRLHAPHVFTARRFSASCSGEVRLSYCRQGGSHTAGRVWRTQQTPPEGRREPQSHRPVVMNGHSAQSCKQLHSARARLAHVGCTIGMPAPARKNMASDQRLRAPLACTSLSCWAGKASSQAATGAV